MSDSEAQRVLERLVADPEFRARFELDPTGAARAAGFGHFADDLAAADPAPMQALDVRESRSSLAGAFIAAAAEGLALVEFGGRLFGVDEAQAAVGSAPPANGQPWHADWYGMEGSGGPVTPETTALLHNPNVTFEPAGIEDLKAGRIDPRVVSVLTEISREHKIVVTCTCSDHPMNTAGGSVSNHYYGRGLDIGSVDGKLVNAANPAARELALELAKLDPSIRPSEIGSPWALSGAAYFTDGDHQDHLHVGFDDPITPGWKPPAEESSPEPSDSPLPVQPNSPQPAEVDDDTAGDDLRADGTVDTSGDDDAEDDSDDQDDAEDDSGDQDSAEAASAAAAPLSPDPDDWEGNLDDEDGGADEVDGSNEDEADEGGGEDDDGVATSGTEADTADGSDESDDSEDTEDSDEEDDDAGGDEDEEEDEDEDEGADEPGEGSNGEDATDDNADSDSSDSSNPSNPSTPSDSSDDESDSGDSSGDSSDSSDSSNDASDGSDGPSSDPSADLEAPGDYPGDDAPREQVAAWMAAEAEQRGLPPELPVMASLVESGLRNLNYGDADSVGFFQMRTSIWDQGAYAGYQDRAELQLKWFLDHAEAVKGARVAAGEPVDDPKSFGEWIADIERPAEQYRGRYQLRLDEARALLDAADPNTDSPGTSAGNEAQVLKAVDPDAADSDSG